MKSMNMISTTGLSPAVAAPMASPMTVPSLIGVLTIAIDAEFFRQSFGDAERTAEGDVFAEDIHRRVAAHLFGETGANGFENKSVRA